MASERGASARGLTTHRPLKDEAVLAAAKAIARVARLDGRIGLKEGPVDRVAEELLRRMRFDRRDPVGK